MTPRPEKDPLPPPAAVMAAFFVIAVEADLVGALLLSSSAGFRGLRAAHFALAALQLLGCGALVAAAVAGFQRAHRLPVLPFVLLGALGAGALVLPEDLGGFAEKISEKHTAILLPILIAVVALAITAGVAVLRWITRRFSRVPAAVIALLLGALNLLVLEHDYPGVHLIVALVAGVLLAIALAGMRTPRAFSGLVASPIAGAAIGAISIAAILAPIPNRVVFDMLRATGAVVAPFASRLHGAATLAATIPDDKRPWFSPRAALPPAPPRGPRLLPDDAIVVLLTVDALRADVIMSGKYDADLPSFAALKEEGVRFTRARAPGAQTVPVITGLFTGKYYSQVYWSGGKAQHAWPHEDPSVRFPEILRDMGVVTVTYPTLPEVTGPHGVARGFVEERFVSKRPKGEASPLAATVADRLRTRLNAAAGDPRAFFLYAHFVDAHAPYTRGGTDCVPFDCYLREVALIDEAIGQILQLLKSPRLAKRAVLIVTADHGEAFGEHQQRFHATTLYDELLRVPLIVSSELFHPRDVDVPVTVLDLGPTILELFGQPTPAAFMGESLVRLLRGEPDRLTRPIAADSGRLMQALIFDDNIKIIRNNRNHTVELYDLNKDPGETQSIFETAPDAEQRLGMIKALFDANLFRKEGYSAPYRK